MTQKVQKGLHDTYGDNFERLILKLVMNKYGVCRSGAVSFCRQGTHYVAHVSTLHNIVRTSVLQEQRGRI
jgi:hypothetical protein